MARNSSARVPSFATDLQGQRKLVCNMLVAYKTRFPGEGYHGGTHHNNAVGLKMVVREGSV